MAKEILFGLEDGEVQSSGNTSLIAEIIKETEANSISNDIRATIDQNFAGIKSSIDDESHFKNEEELNAAIEETKKFNNDQQCPTNLKKYVTQIAFIVAFKVPCTLP